MIHPLINNTKVADITQVGHTIFRQHMEAFLGDHFCNPMIDLRVQMIRTSRKNYASFPFLIEHQQSLFAFLTNVFFEYF